MDSSVLMCNNAPDKAVFAASMVLLMPDSSDHFYHLVIVIYRNTVVFPAAIPTISSIGPPITFYPTLYFINKK